MNVLGLQDLYEVLQQDSFLSVLETDGYIAIHDDMDYPLIEHRDTSISIGIEPVNPMSQRNLTNDYVVMFRSCGYEHEIEGDLYEALSEAVDRLKIAVVLEKL
ncbi:hypothetical protein PEC302107_13330 [Pectobacterium araliae]|uniref:hypothetical protein n=1 Tax=Pectobacterium araliae TaxID=3073862 RepID=UPI00208C6793|nr:hypothetical protein PEC302107_13330 [Pectobacterium carotovorum subsp. carotovorum]